MPPRKRKKRVIRLEKPRGMADRVAPKPKRELKPFSGTTTASVTVKTGSGKTVATRAVPPIISSSQAEVAGAARRLKEQMFGPKKKRKSR